MEKPYRTHDTLIRHICVCNQIPKTIIELRDIEEGLFFICPLNSVLWYYILRNIEL